MLVNGQYETAKPKGTSAVLLGRGFRVSGFRCCDSGRGVQSILQKGLVLGVQGLGGSDVARRVL